MIIIFFLSLIAILLYFRLVMKKTNKIETTQDLIGGKNVTVYPNGIVESGNVYRLVIEVQPANLSTASNQEKKSVWSQFFLLMNTLGIPNTLLVQSQYLEVKDYTDWYEEQTREHELTEPLRQSGLDVKKYIEHSTEDSKIRDYRGYVILHYDSVAASVDSGVETGLSQLDSLLNKKEKMNKNEKRNLAEQILDEMAEEVYEFCEKINVQFQRLDRSGIYNVNYAQLQRELSTKARMIDALKMESFKPMKRSWEPSDS